MTHSFINKDLQMHGNKSFFEYRKCVFALQILAWPLAMPVFACSAQLASSCQQVLWPPRVHSWQTHYAHMLTRSLSTITCRNINEPGIKMFMELDVRHLLVAPADNITKPTYKIHLLEFSCTPRTERLQGLPPFLLLQTADEVCESCGQCGRANSTAVEEKDRECIA